MKRKKIPRILLSLAIAVGILTIAALATDGKANTGGPFFSTVWALVPSVVAIALALITKEVYSSLFIGILAGGLLYSNFHPGAAILHVFNDGILKVLSDSYNVGILIFLVILGAIVCMMNRAGGSAAFGRWASQHIKTRVGAEIATIILGMLIFIDDYFNCLTVGSVMRPITDEHQISRAKLAYLIDATAAPICIIAPISSWAAAVSGFVSDGSGLALFIRAIPYNYYALLTIVMLFLLSALKIDYGPMAKFEANAAKGDLFSGPDPYADAEDDTPCENGIILDMVLPILALVVCCVLGMLYSGKFFSGVGFVAAFSGSDASVGLMLGSFFGFVFALIYYLIRRTVPFKDLMDCICEGFKAMVPAILILTFAWSLKAMTDSLGAKEFVASVVRHSAGRLAMFLPAVIFLVGCFLAFATGTSWGTFGILIPIVLAVFPLSSGNPLSVISVSACMAGAVCGDHCSPISDTTIMSSAGAQCSHVDHVSTQLPYAMTAAAVSCVSYVCAGLFATVGVPTWLALPIGIGLLVTVLVLIRGRTKGRQGSQK